MQKSFLAHPQLSITRAFAAVGSLSAEVEFSKSPLERGRREAPGVCQCMNNTQLLLPELAEQETKTAHPLAPLSIAQAFAATGV